MSQAADSSEYSRIQYVCSHGQRLPHVIFTPTLRSESQTGSWLYYKIDPHEMGHSVNHNVGWSCRNCEIQMFCYCIVLLDSYWDVSTWLSFERRKTALNWDDAQINCHLFSNLYSERKYHHLWKYLALEKLSFEGPVTPYTTSVNLRYVNMNWEMLYRVRATWSGQGVKWDWVRRTNGFTLKLALYQRVVPIILSVFWIATWNGVIFKCSWSSE